MVKRVSVSLVLGKSPGATLKKMGRRAYSFRAQRDACKACFDNRWGKGKWQIKREYYREVSAHKDSTWPTTLRSIAEETLQEGSILVAASICRLLRLRRNLHILEDVGVQFFTCDAAVDTTTPQGRHYVAHLVNDAQLEAELTAARVKRALAVARARGKKLGGQNPRVRGKSAKSQKASALQRAKKFLKFLRPLVRKNISKRQICVELNRLVGARSLNSGRPIPLVTLQRMLHRLQEAKLV